MVSTTLIPNTGATMFALEFIFAMAIAPQDHMKENSTKEETIADLERFIATQCTDGNWNDSEYMFGLANGMIFALSVLTSETPKYLDRPDFFLTDLKTLDKFNNSPIIVTHEREADEQIIHST